MSVSVCVCVRSSILAPGARTAGPIGTGEGLFDAPDRQKDDGANRVAIGARWHVPRANPCKKSVDKAAGLTKGRIGLNFCETKAT